MVENWWPIPRTRLDQGSGVRLRERSRALKQTLWNSPPNGQEPPEQQKISMWHRYTAYVPMAPGTVQRSCHVLHAMLSYVATSYHHAWPPIDLVLKRRSLYGGKSGCNSWTGIRHTSIILTNHLNLKLKWTSSDSSCRWLQTKHALYSNIIFGCLCIQFWTQGKNRSLDLQIISNLSVWVKPELVPFQRCWSLLVHGGWIS